MNVNKSLLNYDFETYRLLLKQLNIKEKRISASLFDLGLEGKLDNLHKAESLGTYNHLVLDNFYPNSIYFISKDLKVLRINNDELRTDIKEPLIIYEIPPDNSEMDTEENKVYTHPKLEFIDNNSAAIYDGKGNIHLVMTPYRNEPYVNDDAQKWQFLSSMKLSQGEDIFPIPLEFRLETIGNSTISSDGQQSNYKFHCVYLQIPATKHEVKSKCSIIWKIWEFDSNTKSMSESAIYKWLGDTVPKMTTLSADLSVIHMVTDHSYRYLRPEIEWGNLTEASCGLIVNWCHDSKESQLIEFYIPKCPENLELKVGYKNEKPNNPNSMESTECQKLFVEVTNNRGKAVEIYSNYAPKILDTSKVTYKVIDNILSVNIMKNSNTNELEGEFEGAECTMEINGTEEVDDCTDVNLAITTFDQQGKVIEEIDISANEWLFNTRFGLNESQLICIRKDVDALIFQKSSNNSPWIHKHTLNAFGYITASKQERKYLVCSLPTPTSQTSQLATNDAPASDENKIDLAIVVDMKRDIYIYRQNRELPTLNQMKVFNRNTKKVVTSVADQYFVSLKSSECIMGVCVNNAGKIFVLYSLKPQQETGGFGDESNGQLGVAVIDVYC